MILSKKRSVDLISGYLGVLSLMYSNGLVFADSSAPAPLADEKPNTAVSESFSASDWSNHFQVTTVTQTHGTFSSAYQGQLSLKPSFEIPSSVTSTLFVGRKLWKNAYFFANPEESIGAGLSQTHGIAAFPNGEIYRVDDPLPKTNLSRLFFQQDFGLGSEKEKVEDQQNQFAGLRDVQRWTLVAGKFSLNDYMDDNLYSHDPRTQFLNWGFMDTLAWDYAADTRGYTWGFFIEYHLSLWSFRVAFVQEPIVANGLDLDGDLVHAHGDNAEIEYRYKLGEHSGKIRFLSYMNHGLMGNYRKAIDEASVAGVTPDITTTRSYSTKYGFGLNFEQEINSDLGVFSRLGWNDGATETWAFTEVEDSVSVGASLSGARWSRPNDVIGLGFLANGLGQDHRDYLAAGGVGFLVGDGPGAGAAFGGHFLNYAIEELMELYYLYKPIQQLGITPDFQYVIHPGYNSDRGPVAIYSLRFHLEI